jgi:hypothetical protein
MNDLFLIFIFDLLIFNYVETAFLLPEAALLLALILLCEANFNLIRLEIRIGELSDFLLLHLVLLFF